MAKSLKLLLTENVDSLGIVGDVVNVRTGYARNFLLPRNMATTPSDEAIQAVAAKRADAQKQLAEVRKHREELIQKMAGAHITLIRSCNDLGHLYASITQQEIASALAEAGFKGIKPRDVRLNQTIKRVDNYDIHIKFESDLDSTIKLTVAPDRKLELQRHEEPAPAPTEAGEKPAEGAQPDAEAKPAKGEKPAKEGKAEKGAKPEKGEAGEKPAKGEKREKEPKSEKGGDAHKKGKSKDGAEAAPAEAKKTGGGWGTPVSKPEDFDLPVGRRSRRR
jgi:large subunit ribosomal protein L9